MTPTLHFQKLAAAAAPIYYTGQGMFFTLYGMKEVLWDGIRVKKQLRSEQADRIASVWSDTRHSLAELGIIHGFYYAGMGISAICGYKSLSWISLLFANIYMLKQSVEMYRQAQQRPDHPTSHAVKISAIMGILNSLGYCITAAFILLDAPAALCLIFGLIGVTIGCIKILYDFLVLNAKLNTPDTH